MKKLMFYSNILSTSLGNWDAPRDWRELEDDTLRHHKARDRHREDMRRWMSRTGLM